MRLTNGDITVPGLGLDAAERADLEANVAEIYHLAAVYDLSTPRAFAWKVNVEGTHNVVEVAGACKDFQRLQYVSTCYVSGRYTGIFRETDLQVGPALQQLLRGDQVPRGDRGAGGDQGRAAGDRLPAVDRRR